MTVQYQELLSITLNHSYYTNDTSQDFEFIFNEATERLFRKGRLVAKVYDNKLIVYAETRDNQLTLSLTNKRITVALVLSNPFFYNFTQKPTVVGTQLYHNDTVLQVLSAAIPTRVVGQRFEHTISKGKRAVTLELRNERAEIEPPTLINEPDVNSVNYLLKEPEIDRFKVLERYSDETVVQQYFNAAEFSRDNIDRIVTLRLDNSFILSKPQFSVNFAAVMEKLNYYIIARNYGDEFNQLNVSGLDKSGAGVPVSVGFKKIISEDFTSQHLSKEVLDVDGDTRLVLFHSVPILPRRNIPQLDIQLTINGDTLIPTLPLTGPERPTADFIVHLSKPKT